MDIGSSSVRGALYDAAANRLDHTFVKNVRQLTVTGDGGAEIDADEAFGQVVDAITEVLEHAKTDAARIRFVAASCFWHSLVGVDANGDATTPVFGWADTRSAKYVKDLQANFDEATTHNRTGARFHPSYWTAKLLWLRHERAEIFAKTAKWLSFADFLALKLFGEAATNVSSASGTGVFAVRECVWDAELLEFIGVNNERLPRIADDAETFRLSENWAAGWPDLRETKWFLPIGDGAANNIGAGCTRGDLAALMIGTSGAMRVIFAGDAPPDLPRGLFCYRVDRQRFLLGGALSDGGGLFRWLKDNLILPQLDDDIENLIAAREPDSHGLTFLPFLAGERSTNWNAAATGAILGLHTATTAVDIAQAALESVAYRFAAIAEQIGEDCKLNEIIASGEALRQSPVWTQIIADALNATLILPDLKEVSSRGAALFGLEKAGIIKDFADLPQPTGQIFAPDAAKHQIYQQARERQERFYDRINPNSRKS